MRWVTFCRIFFVSESALAALINLYVLISVWRRRIDVNASTYRIGITVMSVSAIFQALLQCYTITIHQIHDNVYTLVQLGPTGWMSEGAREVCTVLTQTCIFLMWEWIPASCILQYLALCRPRFSTSKRLFIAYAYCLVCICVCSPFSVTFINERAWDAYVQDAVRMVQGIEANEEVYGYGATTNVVPENNNRTIWPFVFVASASYVWSYGAFVVTTVLIYRALRTDGVKLTKKTLAMQRRFWKMLVLQVAESVIAIRFIHRTLPPARVTREDVLQGFVPLLVCGFPVTLFIGNIIAGTSMDRSTIIMTCGIFAAPTVQGLVSLTFVRRMKKKEEPSESNSDSNRRASSRTATHPVESGL